MRKQYHFRRNDRGGLDAWDVDRLVVLVADQPVEDLPLGDIAELDTEYWFDHAYATTVRAVVEHFRLMTEVDLSFPIVVDPEGRVMDGMHRVARALAEGRTSVAARRLPSMPEPDHRDVDPDDLTY